MPFSKLARLRNAPKPHRVQCGSCGQVGTPASNRREAQRYAGVHDELHHRGAPTAVVRPC